MKNILLIIAMVAMFSGCYREQSPQEKADKAAVQQQQQQYATRQPIPFFDFSYEREIVRQLYMIRNKKVATYAVWRSDYGLIEGDCPCVGYAVPYTTSMTNPLQIAVMNSGSMTSGGVIEQAEPNGLFPSKTTNATWVPCLNNLGSIDPVYVEGKVTVYPYPVTVDYEKNRVTKAGPSTVKIEVPDKDKR